MIGNANHNKVALTRCDNYTNQSVSDAIKDQFELLGGLGKFVKRCETVLIKPNLIAPRSPEIPAQTNPTVIVELARLLIDFGARPFVGDSSAWTNAGVCIKALGIESELKKLGVPVKNLTKAKKCKLDSSFKPVPISVAALEADKIINLPKFKAHKQLVATFAIKNMFGCVSGKRKALYHFSKGKNENRFCKFLVDIYRRLGPAVTIIDAVTAMQGLGPIGGEPRRLNLLIGSVDPVACEKVCAELVGLDCSQLPILRTAKQIGFGSWNGEQIEIVGEKIDDFVCDDFVFPQLVPIRFSFGQVCKSISKQAVLLTRAAIGGKKK